ncbi:lysostaphin resistance A-like protein [Nocardioides sp. MH1]|uniref:CPBP family intramembrane glutamic endopeptidase n=1 Tax=Nocardioides sp. MH1 TaxID=3242490 RepID=UPI003522AE31
MPSADVVGGGAGAGAGAGMPLRYPALHRLGRASWPRTLLGVLVAVVVVLAIVPTLLAGVYAGLGEPFGDADFDPLTPAGLTIVSLTWAAAIPTVLLVTHLVQEVRGSWALSVVAAIRWRWLVTCIGLSVVAILAAVLVAAVLPDRGGVTLDDSVNDLTGKSLAFAVIIVFLVPLQSAGEEFAFRGYLTQSLGGVLHGRIGTAVAVAVPAVAFALAHGAQDPPVFVDRLTFGLVAGVLVVLTGGLEAGIAMHVVNNWASFGLTLLFGDLTGAVTPDISTWWLLPGTLVQNLGYLALVLWMHRRTGLRATVEPGVLERPRPRV